MAVWGDGIFANDTAADAMLGIRDALTSNSAVIATDILDHVPNFDSTRELDFAFAMKFWSDFGQVNNIINHLQLFDSFLDEDHLSYWVDPKARALVLQNLFVECLLTIRNGYGKYEPTSKNIWWWTECADEIAPGVFETMLASKKVGQANAWSPVFHKKSRLIAEQVSQVS